MIRWRSKCEYQAGRYPVIALVNLFFLLLLLFVLSNSMLYLPGVLLSTNAGQVEESEEGMLVSSLSPREDFSQYVIADKMVLTIDSEGEMELNTRPVTLDLLDRELENEANKLLRMYGNSHHFSRDEAARKAFRPKLVLSASSNVPVGLLDDVISRIRNKKMDVVFKTSKSGN